MIPDELYQIMTKYNIIVIVVVNLDSDEIEEIGDRNMLESDHIIRTLFDDLSISEISCYLDGKILPQLGQQGRVCSIICKPDDNTVVGLYYHDESNVLERYRRSKIINEEIISIYCV